MRRVGMWLFAIIALTGLVAAGCGTDDGDGSSGGGMEMDAGGGNDSTSARFEEVDCSEVDSATEVEVGPDFKFVPADATVPVGGVVRWTWAENVTKLHDVVADNDADCEEAKPSWFESEQTRTPGHTYCVRFQETGTWNYQCTVPGHCPAGMKGTVTVESK